MDDLEKLKRNLGVTLLSARERAGLTQADVSSMVGLVPAVYGRIERGRMLPSVPSLYRICEALRLSANEALGLDSEPAMRAPSPSEEATPELRRLARLLRTLSLEELRCLAAIASAIAERNRARRSASNR